MLVGVVCVCFVVTVVRLEKVKNGNVLYRGGTNSKPIAKRMNRNRKERSVRVPYVHVDGMNARHNVD